MCIRDSASSELIASSGDVEKIGKSIGVDKLFYQDLEDLIKSVQFNPTGPQEFDTSCFSGVYVTENISSEYLEKLEQIRNDSAKQHSVLSEEPVGIHNQT